MLPLSLSLRFRKCILSSLSLFCSLKPKLEFSVLLNGVGVREITSETLVLVGLFEELVSVLFLLFLYRFGLKPPLMAGSSILLASVT